MNSEMSRKGAEGRETARQDDGEMNARRVGDLWVVRDGEEIWKPCVAVRDGIVRGLPDFEVGYLYVGDDGRCIAAANIEDWRYYIWVLNGLGEQLSEPGATIRSEPSISSVRNDVGMDLVDGSMQLFQPSLSHWRVIQLPSSTSFSTGTLPFPEFRVAVYRDEDGLELTGVTLGPQLRLEALAYATGRRIELVLDAPQERVAGFWLETRVTGPHGSPEWIHPPDDLAHALCR